MKGLTSTLADELQLLGEIQPGGDDELPELEYTPTTPEEETAVEGERGGEVPQQQVEGIQRDERDEMYEEDHPPLSDAADSNCRGPFGDSDVPGAHEAGDFTMEGELEIMYGNGEQREAMFREAEIYEERRRQREQQEGTGEDVYGECRVTRAIYYTNELGGTQFLHEHGG